MHKIYASLTRTVRIIFKNDVIAGLIVGVLVISPIAFMLMRENGVLAPYNILSGCCGWTSVESSGVVNLIPSDVNDFVMPDRAFIKEALQAGEIPLWNPLYFGGEIFLANLQSTVLHPVNLFLFIFSIHTVQNISALGSLMLMAAGMYLFVRTLRLSRLSSIFAAVVYSLMPFAIFWSTFGMMTWSMAFFPIVLTCLLKWHRTNSYHYLSLMAIILGLSVFMGHIQFSIVNFVLVTLLELSVALFGKGLFVHRLRESVVVGAFVLAGGAIGAIQLLPFLEQVPIGHRQGTVLSTGPDTPEKMLADIGSYFKIYEYKHTADISYFFSYAPFPLVISLLGAVLSVVAMVGGVLTKNKSVALFMVLMAGGLLWMWGSLPHQVLTSVSSIFESLRPTYFISIPLFAAAVLSGYGFSYYSNFIASVQKRMSGRVSQNIALKILSLIVSVVCISAIFVYALLTTIPTTRYMIGAYDMLVYTFSPLIFAVACCAVWSRRLVTLSQLALIAVVFFQGTTLFVATQPISPRSLYTAGNRHYDAIIKDAGTSNPRNIRIVYPYSPQTSMFYGLGALNGYDALYAKKTESLIDAINYPVKTVKLSELSHNAIYINNVQKETVLKTLGVSHIITDDAREAPRGYEIIYSGPRNDVYRSNSPASQIYFAQKVTQGAEEKQLQMIKDASLGYREVVLSERSKGVNNDGSRVQYDVGINAIRVDTYAKSEQLLFIAQTFRPQWQARLDGNTPLKIMQANYNFMAVYVPAGQHSITMRYESKSFNYGRIVSLTAVTTVTAVGIWSFGAKRRKR